MAKQNSPAERGRDKVRPDEGQGSKGNFGNDGDWGKSDDESQKSPKRSSPVPVKKAK